ncbi:hypothetical protein ACLH3R_002273 [Flavobacterium psychrophilum]
MFDKEIEAIAKCTELIKDLDDGSKIRVIKYLIERFNIGTAPMQTNVFVPNRILDQASYESPIIEQKSFLNIENRTDDYPTLKQLLIKNYPKNETEWILCYAFFASKYGEDTFKKEDITGMYRENGRYTTSTNANLSNNINACIKKDWIKDINKDEFILKTEGTDYVKEVLAGNSSAKEVKKTKRTKSNSENIE